MMLPKVYSQNQLKRPKGNDVEILLDDMFLRGIICGACCVELGRNIFYERAGNLHLIMAAFAVWYI